MRALHGRFHAASLWLSYCDHELFKKCSASKKCTCTKTFEFILISTNTIYTRKKCIHLMKHCFDKLPRQVLFWSCISFSICISSSIRVASNQTQSVFLSKLFFKNWLEKQNKVWKQKVNSTIKSNLMNAVSTLFLLLSVYQTFIIVDLIFKRSDASRQIIV